MRKLLFIIVSVLCLFPSVRAQSIVGKWKCPKEFLNSFDLSYYYEDLKGYCKFTKDGKFTMKIKGSYQVDWPSGNFDYVWKKPNRTKSAKYQNMYIKATGTYKIENNRITTTIGEDGLYCYIDPGMSHLIFQT